ncbi:MAG: class I SAM-dependent methyltransferase [Clostridiales bacterium]|nr:class I SAM-dependent methyltransferase [Clostridiales bacterium]
MNIEEQFNIIANEYDKNRRKFIHCFDDYYENTTKFIIYNIAKPMRVLDLGAGTGLLTYYWYQQCPSAEYVLVDIADEMLNIARKRFCGIDNISYMTLDYSKQLPSDDFDAIISALSIHHLSDSDKQKLFKKIYNKLPKNGIFINYDQFCAEQYEMNRWFNSYWEKQLSVSGLTEHDIELWKERRKLDRECSVEKEVQMLSDCGFEAVKCIYSSQKFAVIAAIK